MGPGNKHHNNRHHTHEHNGGQVFFQRQRHQYTQKCCTEAQHTIAEFSCGRTKFPDKSAQSQDHGKFRNFRRLELQASDTDPPPGTVHRLSEQQNHQKQSDAEPIQRPGHRIPNFRGYPAEDPHSPQPQQRTGCLFLQIAGTYAVAGIIPALGIAGRIEHSQPNPQQHQQQDQKYGIHSLPRREIPAAVIFGMRIFSQYRKTPLRSVRKYRTMPERTLRRRYRQKPELPFLPSSRTSQNDGGWETS